MKTDFNLFRDILTAIEEDRLPQFMIMLGNSEDWRSGLDSDQLKATEQKREHDYFKHLKLLIDSGIVEGVVVKQSADLMFSVGYYDPTITIAGADFYNALKSSRVLTALKAMASRINVDLSVNFILDNARAAISSLVSEIGEVLK